jgi:hypothetical protein
VEDILRLVLDTRNHPLLIHDDMGKSVVSVICALVRRMERWSLTGIFAEGDMFAGQAGGSEGSGIGEAGREVCLLHSDDIVTGWPVVHQHVQSQAAGLRQEPQAWMDRLIATGCQTIETLRSFYSNLGAAGYYHQDWTSLVD